MNAHATGASTPKSQKKARRRSSDQYTYAALGGIVRAVAGCVAWSLWRARGQSRNQNINEKGRERNVVLFANSNR